MTTRKKITTNKESDVIQSSRRKRASRIDPLSEHWFHPRTPFAPGDIVAIKWADDELSHIMDEGPRRTGVVLNVLDDTAPQGVEIMWDSGEIDWDYADDLRLIEEGPTHE